MFKDFVTKEERMYEIRSFNCSDYKDFNYIDMSVENLSGADLRHTCLEWYNSKDTILDKKEK